MTRNGENPRQGADIRSLVARLLAAVLMAALLSAAPAGAQNAGPDSLERAAAASVLSEQQAILDDLTKQVDVADKAIVQNAENDVALVQTRQDLEEVLTKTLASGVAFRPRLTEINNRLEQIGPPPPKDQPAESDRVTKERQALTAEKAEINVALGKAEDLSVRVNGLINKISTLRRDLFTNLLTKRYELSDAIGKQVLADVVSEGETLRQRISGAVRYAFRFKFSEVMTATFLALLAALAVQYFGRRFFGRLMTRDPSIEHPSYINRLAVAFWSTLLPSVALALCFGLLIWLYDTYEVLTRSMLLLFAGALSVIWLGALIYRLSTAILSPGQPHWRLIRIESGPARVLVLMMTFLAVVVGLDRFASLVSDTLGSPLSVTIVKSLFGAILSSMVIITIAQVRPFVDENGVARPWPGWFRIILYALGFGSILAAISGYVSFAQFVSTQIVVTGAMVLPVMRSR